MKTHTQYICEYCNEHYSTAEKATLCETYHRVVVVFNPVYYYDFGEDEGYPQEITVVFDDGETKTYVPQY